MPNCRHADVGSWWKCTSGCQAALGNIIVFEQGAAAQRDSMMGTFMPYRPTGSHGRRLLCCVTQQAARCLMLQRGGMAG